MSARTPSLPSRERRTLLLGVGSIAMIVALGRGVPAWRAALQERRDGATQLRAELAGAERALGRHATVRDTLVARGHRLAAVTATLVPGEDDDAADRTLLAMVSGAAAGAQVRLTSTAVVNEARPAARVAVGERGARARRAAPAPRSLMRTVAVRIAGTGDVRGVTTLLEALERGPARLRVRSLAVTQPDVAAGDERVETLQLEMVVEGLAVAHRDSVRAPRNGGAR